MGDLKVHVANLTSSSPQTAGCGAELRAMCSKDLGEWTCRKTALGFMDWRMASWPGIPVRRVFLFFFFPASASRAS